MTTTQHRPAETLDVTIDEARCRTLLGAARVARVAFVDDGTPALAVVHHQVHGKDVLLRTGEDSRLAALTSGGRSIPVVLEVDSVSARERSGWSVCGTGRLTRHDQPEVELLRRPWRGGAAGVGLHLHVERLTGRYLDPMA